MQASFSNLIIIIAPETKKKFDNYDEWIVMINDNDYKNDDIVVVVYK